MFKESTQEHTPTEFSIIDDNDVQSERRKFSDANYKDNFEKWMKARGKAGWWAYQHGIGMYVKREKGEDDETAQLKARARYMGQESWYDEDNFFWLKLDEFDKPLLCQLRVSNHDTQHDKYQKTHSLNKLVQCDSVLNIKIGDYSREAFRPATTEHAIISVDANYDVDNKTEQQIKNVDNFIKKIQNGEQPTITIQQIRAWIDPNARPRFSGGRNVRQNQFEPRPNIVRNRLKVPKWYERKQQQQQQLPKEIPFDDLNFLDKTIEFKGKEYELANYNNTDFAVDYDNLVAYPIKKKGGISTANPITINENKKHNRKMKRTISPLENKLRRIISESVRRTIQEVYHNRALNESSLYDRNIDTSDLKMDVHWTDYGIPSWEASVDNGWYTFRGIYDGFDCELEELIISYNGKRKRFDADYTTKLWFDEYLHDKVKSWLNKNAYKDVDFEDLKYDLEWM